ncbi:exonuclease SbcCD subunit D [Schaalia suimastitidis]|uniref:exonuclease SbcCD subunit D n=1 Tax=Schaalia suimastitidis TaxID=121163 RepID=UPI00047A9458|nr:exonuclease SbcCD subunit D [Schaalia suimastitidis]
MRILHTSDWHCGRSLHGEDLNDAFDAFASWLIETVQQHDVDAVLVSGDLFDRAVPPIHAVNRLSSLLTQLCCHSTVILTPGNHDSATRLGFVAPLLNGRLHIVSDIERIGHAIEVTSATGIGALIYPIPYVEPDAGRTILSNSDEPLARSHQAVLGAALQRIDADLRPRRNAGDDRAAICMVHAFVVGGAPSDSERDIQVGGVDSVPSELFDTLGVGSATQPLAHGLDYVAAGHLHKAQAIAASQVPIRYSGSPLFYSFSEASVSKSAVLLTLDHRSVTSIDLLPIPTFRALASITGTFDDLLSENYTHVEDHWLSITVTDSHRPESMVAVLKKRFPFALAIMHCPDASSTRPVAHTADFRVRNEVDILNDFFYDVGGKELNDAETRVIYDVLTSARQEVMQ